MLKIWVTGTRQMSSPCWPMKMHKFDKRISFFIIDLKDKPNPPFAVWYTAYKFTCPLGPLGFFKLNHAQIDLLVAALLDWFIDLGVF